MDFQKTLENYTQQSITWLNEVLLTVPSLVQLSLIILSVLIGKRIMRPFSRALDVWITSKDASHFAKRIDTKQMGQQLTALGILISASIITLLLISFGQPSAMVAIFSKLVLAWVLIRFVVMLTGNTSFARFFSPVIWVLAALSIMGVLDSAVEALESVSFSLGKVEVNLFSVFTGVLTLVITIYVASRLSALLERKIERLPNLTPSARVLIKKISKITLLVLAFMVAMNSMGIDLTALAVFGGAVGLGVGFGLQKVISNLFSGFILLIDRSIKPGDVIQVDDTFGWVNTLGSRCVSILTRDGIEYLVPNEHLITERVINWSYSSKDVRQKIPLGVSYDSDLHKAIALVVEVAQAHKRVLQNPAPVCRVVGFGDSAVDLELRIWISDPVEGIVNVRSDLLLGIWDAFKEHGIQIPYPQRDVHLKLSEELTKMIKNDTKLS